MNVENLLTVILGAGGAGFIAAIVQAISSWRNGVEQGEIRAIANLEKWRDQAVAQAEKTQALLDIELAWSRYWRLRCGQLEFIINAAGLQVPLEPIKPDEFFPARPPYTPPPDLRQKPKD